MTVKTLLVYGQLSPGDELLIFGNSGGLMALQEAIKNSLANNGRGVTQVSCKTMDYKIQVNCKSNEVLNRMPDPTAYCESGADDASILNWIDANKAKVITHEGWMTKVTWGSFNAPKSAVGKNIREAIIKAMAENLEPSSADNSLIATTKLVNYG